MARVGVEFVLVNADDGLGRRLYSRLCVCVVGR